MVGIVIVCHGQVASSLLQSSHLFFGETQKVLAIDYDLNEGVNILKTRLENAIKKLSGDRIIFLTDLLGGSPTNICVELLKKYPGIDLYTGVNLPMFLEILFNRERITPDELLKQAIEGAHNGIINYREFINPENRT